MNIFSIVWKNLVKRKLSSFLTILSVALGAALVIAVQVAEKETERSFNQTSVGYDLILAAPGSRMQTTLNTIYHLETSTGIIPFGVYEVLKNDPRVEFAYPFYVGDSYQGYRVVGTTANFLLKGQPRAGESFEFAEGRIFERPFEAVIGFDTANQLGLSIGDKIVFTHGVAEVAEGAEAHTHDDDPTKIVGILKRTSTANDRIIFTSVFTTHALHSAHDYHDHDHEDDHHDHDHQHNDDHHHNAHSHDHHSHNGHNHNHEHNHGDSNDHHNHDDDHADHDDHDHHAHQRSSQTLEELEMQVTELDAVLVKFTNQALAIQVAGMLNFPTPQNPLLARNLMRDPLFPYKDDLMGVIPAIQIQELMSLVGNAEQVLRSVAMLVFIVALIGVLVALYNTMEERRRDIAIMRSLGARRRSILFLMLMEAAFITVIGCILGLFLGHGIVSLASPHIAQNAGIVISGFTFDADQFKILFVFVALGILAGLIPALKAYKTDVVSNLSR